MLLKFGCLWHVSRKMCLETVTSAAGDAEKCNGEALDQDLVHQLVARHLNAQIGKVLSDLDVGLFVLPNVIGNGRRS